MQSRIEFQHQLTGKTRRGPGYLIELKQQLIKMKEFMNKELPSVHELVNPQSTMDINEISILLDERSFSQRLTADAQKRYQTNSKPKLHCNTARRDVKNIRRSSAASSCHKNNLVTNISFRNLQVVERRACTSREKNLKDDRDEQFTFDGTAGFKKTLKTEGWLPAQDTPQVENEVSTDWKTSSTSTYQCPSSMLLEQSRSRQKAKIKNKQQRNRQNLELTDSDYQTIDTLQQIHSCESAMTMLIQEFRQSASKARKMLLKAQIAKAHSRIQQLKEHLVSF